MEGGPAHTLYCGRCENSSVELATPSAVAGASALALAGAGFPACADLAALGAAAWWPDSLSVRRPGGAVSLGALVPPPLCRGSAHSVTGDVTHLLPGQHACTGGFYRINSLA